MSREAHILKELLMEGTYKYVSNMKQDIPLNEEGMPNMDYLNYVSLYSVHNLLESITRDLANTIIKVDGGDKKFVSAETSCSFYIVPKTLLEDEIMPMLSKMTGDEEYSPRRADDEAWDEPVKSNTELDDTDFEEEDEGQDIDDIDLTA